MLDSILYNVFFVFTIFYVATFFVVGIHFYVRGYRTKMSNLLYAGSSFLLMAISQLLSRIVTPFKIVEVAFIAFSLIFVVIFINKSFYKERDSMIFKKDRRTYLPNTILALTIISSTITCFTSIFVNTPYNTPENNFIYILTTVIQRCVVFHWAGFSSYFAYKNLKGKKIRPWITFRYKIFSITSFLLGFQPFVILFQPYEIPFGSPHSIESMIVFGITALIALIYSIGSFLIWIMPNWLKKHLDRNYPHHDENEEYSEAELLALIKNQLIARK